MNIEIFILTIHRIIAYFIFLVHTFLINGKYLDIIEPKTVNRIIELFSFYPATAMILVMRGSLRD